MGKVTAPANRMDEQTRGEHVRRVAEAAEMFLCEFAKTVETTHGGLPRRVQRSLWYVPRADGSGSADPRQEEREIVDIDAIDRAGFEAIRQDTPTVPELRARLVDAGVPDAEVPYMHIWGLLREWSRRVASTEHHVSDSERALAAEFAEHAVFRRGASRARYVLRQLHLDGEGVPLGETTAIRRITADELFEFGDHHTYPELLGTAMLRVPQVDSPMLDVAWTYPLRGGVGRERLVIRHALAALRLASAGGFQIELVDLVARHGSCTRNSGYLTPPMTFYDGAAGGYRLDSAVRERLRRVWPSLTKLMDGQHPVLNYLRLPAERLLDGTGRQRHEETVADYAIGLEALLTNGIHAELKYRFALRGAMVLSWSGGDRKDAFDRLDRFYKVRSTVLHGDEATSDDLLEARKIGESVLREVWWWFFNQGVSGKEATRRIDDRILGS